MCVCVWQGAHMPQHMCEGLRTTFNNKLSSTTMWVLGMEFWSSGLVTSTCWAISRTPPWILPLVFIRKYKYLLGQKHIIYWDLKFNLDLNTSGKSWTSPAHKHCSIIQTTAAFADHRGCFLQCKNLLFDIKTTENLQPRVCAHSISLSQQGHILQFPSPSSNHLHLN